MVTRTEWIEEARNLRRLADSARNAFMKFLLDGERQPELWQDGGLIFVDFLERYDLVRPTSYLRWKRGFETDEDLALSVGVAAVIAAGTLKTETERREMLEEARVWEKTNGTSISEQSATTLRRCIREAASAAHEVQVSGRHRGAAELRLDNERLRVQVDNLENTASALRAEVRAVKKINRALTKKLQRLSETT